MITDQEIHHNMLRIPLDSKGYIPATNDISYEKHFKTRFINGDHELHKVEWPAFSKITGNIDGVSTIENEDKCCVYIYCKHSEIYNDPNRTPAAAERGLGTFESPYVSLEDAWVQAVCYIGRTCWNAKIQIISSEKVRFPHYPSFIYGTERIWIAGNENEIEGDYIPPCIVSGFKHNGGERLSGFILYNCQINNVVSLSCSYFVDSTFNNTLDKGGSAGGTWAYNCKLRTTTGVFDFYNMYKTEAVLTRADFSHTYKFSADFAYDCSFIGAIFTRDSFVDEDPDDEMKVVVTDCTIWTAVKSSFFNCRSLDSRVMKDVSYVTEAQVGWEHSFFYTLSAPVMDNVSVTINIKKLRIYDNNFSNPTAKGIVAILKNKGAAFSNVSASVNISQILPMPSDGNYSGVFMVCEVAERPTALYKCLSGCRKLPFRSGNASAPDVSKFSCDEFDI